MKISRSWLVEYIDLDISLDELTEILTAIGLEVGGVEEVESVRGGLRGVVAGKVLTCIKHPNADRLSLCTVDTGNGEPSQIVCGAPNVAVGQTVWVATVGTKLYPSASEEALTIKKAKVRGEVSEGMICAEDELGLGEDHSGIMVLSDDIEAGQSAAEYYNVSTDHVIDIDLTPNRSDAISHQGVARDLAAYLRIHNGHSGRVVMPEVSLGPVTPSDKPVSVEVLNSEACPRYSGLLLEGVRIGPSPQWLQDRLKAIDLRPINNVVDITNFVLYEMGQPLHAFDADRIGSAGVVVQTLDNDTPFVTLDEVERKLSSDDLMICDADNKGMCIAGVFGGVGTGVTEATTRIFLESAHFSPDWIRRTSTRHNLRTDAARAYEKTTDPNICVDVLKRAASMMCEMAGANVASEIVDIYPSPIEPVLVTVRWEHINNLIGVELSRERVKEILDALHMGIDRADDEAIVVSVPTDKADVTREADVIEEILRIHGFDNVPVTDRLEISLIAEELPTLYAFRNAMANFLTALGFNEMMAMSLTDTERYQGSKLALEEGTGILIDNTSNVGLNLMRPDLLVSAMEAAAYNNNRNQKSFRLFEFGRGYQRDDNGIKETEFMTLAMQGREYPVNWLDDQDGDLDYHTLKKYVDAVSARVGLKNHTTAQISSDKFAYGTQYSLDGKMVVEFGEVNKRLLSQFDVKTRLFYAQFDVMALFAMYGDSDITMEGISKYPSVKRDLAFILDEATTYEELERSVRRKSGKTLKRVALFDVYRNEDQLGAGKKSYAIEMAFQDPTRTLTDADVDQTINRIVKAVKADLGAALRD